MDSKDGGPAKLTEPQWMVLRDIAERVTTDIRSLAEPYRQRAIDLAMMEPPLVDIDGDFLFLTDAGRAMLTERKRTP